jgi:hypothetical protein
VRVERKNLFKKSTENEKEYDRKCKKVKGKGVGTLKSSEQLREKEGNGERRVYKSKSCKVKE